MFKPELWQNHNEYRTVVNTYGHRLSRDNTKYSFDLYDKERQKLLNLFVLLFRLIPKTLLYPVTAQRLFPMLPLTADISPPARKLALTGHPLCLAGYKMCPWGNDSIKDAHKYRCPLKCGRIDSCLQHLKMRGRDHFSFWTMLIGICIHLDLSETTLPIYFTRSGNLSLS